ncbi:hypothetical protein HID58_065052, partial [Brassica napus]
MDTVVPPDLPLVTTGESPSKVEARGFDQETRLEMDLTELTQKLTNDLGLKSSDTGGSGDLSSTAIDLVEKEEGLVPMVSSEKGTVKGGSKGSWVGAVQGKITIEITEDNVEEERKSSGGEIEQLKEVSEKEAGWLDVSMGKSSRSPSGRQRELEVDQDTILSQSRFSVLMHEEEGEWVESDREEVVQLEGGSLHEELEEMDEIIP